MYNLWINIYCLLKYKTVFDTYDLIFVRQDRDQPNRELCVYIYSS